MKNLKPFNGDTRKEYKDAVGRKPKNSNSRKRLDLIESDINTAYDCYQENFERNSLHAVTDKIWTHEIKDDLLSLYGYQKKVIRNIKSNITNQQIITIQTTCQNCTIDSVNTMDHILPKEKFPEYAVNGYNLFPCCSRCNGYKSENNEHSAFLNLFLDELPATQYLFVKVYWDIDSVNFDFYISNKEGIIPNELYTKIENHYTNLHLFQRMKNASQTYLSDFIFSNRSYYMKYGKDAVIEAVIDKIKENRNAYGFNYWKCSLEQALIESIEFWKYMDTIS